jgi:hypothetical protein
MDNTAHPNHRTEACLEDTQWSVVLAAGKGDPSFEDRAGPRLSC